MQHLKLFDARLRLQVSYVKVNLGSINAYEQALFSPRRNEFRQVDGITAGGLQL